MSAPVQISVSFADAGLESAAGHRRRSPSLAHRPCLQGESHHLVVRFAPAAVRPSAFHEASVATCPDSLHDARRTSKQGFSRTRGRAPFHASKMRPERPARGTASLWSRQESLVSSSLFCLTPTAQKPFLALNPLRTSAGLIATCCPAAPRNPRVPRFSPLRRTALPAAPADNASPNAPQEVDPLC